MILSMVVKMLAIIWRYGTFAVILPISFKTSRAAFILFNVELDIGTECEVRQAGG